MLNKGAFFCCCWSMHRPLLCKIALCQGNCFWTAAPIFPKMPEQLPTPYFISLLLQNTMQHRAHTPAPTGIDGKHCHMHLPWWNWVKMPTADSKVSCFDLGAWERGSSSFLQSPLRGLRRQHVVTHEIQFQVPALLNSGWPGIKELYFDKHFELWFSHSLICPLAHVYNMCKTAFPLPTTGEDLGHCLGIKTDVFPQMNCAIKFNLKQYSYCSSTHCSEGQRNRWKRAKPCSNFVAHR